MKRSLTLLFVISLLFSACTKDATPAPTAQKAEGGIATQTSKPKEAEATREAAPTLSGPAIAHLPAGKFVYISYIQMLSVTLGWGVSRVDGGDDHIMLTQDAGQTWADRTPPEGASSAGKLKRAHLYFTSMQKGFVIYMPEEPTTNPLYIWSTLDGGETWSASPILDTQDLEGAAFSFQKLLFADEDTGWLLLTGDPGAGQAPAVIFRTTDGGEQWERILDPQSAETGSLGSCCQTGAAFMNNKVGLVTSSVPAYPAAHVNWTKDGGKSWSAQDLPVADETVFANSLCATESPVVVGGSTLLLVVDCTEFVGSIQKHVPYLYFTADQGKNWQYLPLPVTPYAEGKWDSLTRSNEIFFTDDQNGWFFTEDTYTAANKKVETKNQVFRTTDGGQSWEKINTSIWIGQYSFLNAQTIFCAALFNTAFTLVKTSDGGVTWLKLAPKSRE